ncbi:YybH family protein [Acidobacteriota bacterium]
MDIVAEKANVQSVLNQYTKAWETLDIGLFSKVFSHDDNMVVFSASPNKRYVGWELFKEGVQNSFKEIESAKISFRDILIKVHASGNIAWLSCLEDWDFVYQGQPVSDEGARVTWILEKRDGQWVIIHAHWSMPPKAETIAF